MRREWKMEDEGRRMQRKSSVLNGRPDCISIGLVIWSPECSQDRYRKVDRGFWLEKLLLFFPFNYGNIWIHSRDGSSRSSMVKLVAKLVLWAILFSVTIGGANRAWADGSFSASHRECSINMVYVPMRCAPVVQSKGSAQVVRCCGEAPVIRGCGSAPVAKSRGEAPVIRSCGSAPVSTSPCGAAPTVQSCGTAPAIRSVCAAPEFENNVR
jgi:hypothetical protein